MNWNRTARYLKVQRLPIFLTWMLMSLMTASTSAEAQDGDRAVRVWVDTLDLNVCQDRAFNMWGVWLESSAGGDTSVGFRTQDSVLVCSLTLRWDTSVIRLQPPYIFSPPQTLFGRFPRTSRVVDTTKGELYIEVSADERLRTVIGTDIPLFYLVGNVRGIDTLSPPSGGAKVQFLEIQGTLGERINSLEFTPGFVRVIRDTTPEYTGTIAATPGDFDTNRVDTISILAENLSNMRVKEIRFSLTSDTIGFRFLDTIESGTIAGRALWSSKQVSIADDSLFVSLASNTDLDEIGTDTLIQVIIERKVDQEFQTTLEIPEFGTNVASCLGKLVTIGSSVTADSIPQVDTTTSSIDIVEQSSLDVRISVHDNKRVRLDMNGAQAESVELFDVRGRALQRWEVNSYERIVVVELPSVPDGSYFVAVHGIDGQFWYKQLVIQTK